MTVSYLYMNHSVIFQLMVDGTIGVIGVTVPQDVLEELNNELGTVTVLLL